MNPSNPSFRQAGVRKTGLIHQGPPHLSKRRPDSHPGLKERPKVFLLALDSNDGQRSIPSIPTRYETILHIGNREHNGFGIRTTRFIGTESDVPAPGSYHKPTSLIRTEKESGSVSRKGYGPIASQTKRFNAAKELELGQLPAPGQYDCGPAFSSRRDFSTLEASATFAKPFKPIALGAERPLPVPGPGAYELPEKRKSHSCASVFKSRSKRDSYIIPSETPAPGSYNTVKSFSKRVKKPKFEWTEASGFFRSSGPRTASLVRNNVPGPGEYTPVEYAWTIMAQGGGGRRRSAKTAAFSNTHLDRFGRPVNRKVLDDPVPGPGAYFDDEGEEEAMTPSRPEGGPRKYPRKTVRRLGEGMGKVERRHCSSAVFTSGTKRGFQLKRHEVRPPGPAFYNPKPLSKKKFCLNLTGKWV